MPPGRLLFPPERMVPWMQTGLNFELDFEIAAIFLMTTFLVVYLLKSHLPIRLNRIFWLLSVSVLAVNLLDVASVLLARLAQDWLDPINYFVNVLLFLTQGWMISLFFVFVLTMSEAPRRMRNLLACLSGAVLAVYLALVVTTPFTHLVFYFEDGLYLFGPWHGIVYFLPLLFLCGSLFVQACGYQKLKRGQQLSLLLFSVLIAGSTFVQAVFFPGKLFIYFFAALGLLITYFSFQSPEYYLDYVTDIFNENGCREVIKDQFLTGRSFAAIVVCPSNLAIACEGMSLEAKNDIHCRFIENLRGTLPRKTCLYQLSNAVCLFAADEKAPPDVLAKNILESLRSKNKLLDTGVLVAHAYTDFAGYEDLDELAQHLQLATTAARHPDVMRCDRALIDQIQREKTVLGALRSAIRTGGISIVYQPIYNVQRNAFCSAEALVRLTDTGKLGPVSPAEFIPLAERENLINALGDLILTKICAFIRAHELWRSGLSCIHVNLSAKQCMQKDLYHRIRTALEEYGIPPGFLNFELTETAMVESPQQLTALMTQLIELGCAFSLDDFGCGMANSDYLFQYPFRQVKLDKSLLWPWLKDHNEKSSILLHAMIGAVHQLGLPLVAEGVEDAAMVSELAGLQVEQLQGYHFARPLPEEQFLQFLQQPPVAAG